MARSRKGPGISAWRMAKEDGIPYARLRRAIDSGQVKIVEFGGVTIITPAERERVRKLLLGIEPSEEDEQQLTAAE